MSGYVTLYKIVDRTTGLAYVGQTIEHPCARFVGHARTARAAGVRHRMDLVGPSRLSMWKLGTARTVETATCAEAWLMVHYGTVGGVCEEVEAGEATESALGRLSRRRGLNTELPGEPRLFSDVELSVEEVDLSSAYAVLSSWSRRGRPVTKDMVAEWASRRGYSRSAASRAALAQRAGEVSARELTREEASRAGSVLGERGRTALDDVLDAGVELVDAWREVYNRGVAWQECDVSRGQSSPSSVALTLQEAVEFGDEGAVRGALDAGAEATSEHLQRAVQRGEVGVAQLLLMRGVDAGPCLRWRAFVVAKRYGELDVVRRHTPEAQCEFIANHTMRHGRYSAATSESYEAAAVTLEEAGRARLAALMRRCKKRFDALALPEQRRRA